MGVSRRQFTREFKPASIWRLESGVSLAEVVREWKSTSVCWIIGRVRSPQSNGIYEAFTRLMQEESYSGAFRKKLYTWLEELQLDLDRWMREPNTGGRAFRQTMLRQDTDAEVPGFGVSGPEKLLDHLTITNSSDAAGLRIALE